jgi:hypothetical protein
VDLRDSAVLSRIPGGGPKGGPIKERMEMGISVLLAGAALLMQGGVVTMDELEVDSEQAVLENVALCFSDAVGFLQRTPVLPEEYATLLSEAKGILDGMGIQLGLGDFSILTWSEDGLSVLTPAGSPITCALVSEEHDSTAEGSTFFFTYEFSVPGDSLRSTAVIELSL